MSVGSFLKGIRLGRNIGRFFKSLFNSAEKIYNNLPEADKQSLLHGSGLIAILNSEINKTPAEIRAIITTKFPDMDEAVLETTLFGLAHAFGLQATSFDDVVTALQKYLSSQSGKIWEGMSHGLASLATLFFAKDSTTKTGVLIQLLEYVYQHLIKKQ